MSIKKAVTIEDLKKTHGSRAEEVYNRIANIGGFGSVGNFHGGKPDLDINGCSEKALAEIEKILADVEKPGEDKPNDADDAKKKEGKK